MSTHCLCNFFIGSNLGAHDSGAPAIQEFAGPRRCDVIPKPSEIFLEQLGAPTLEIILQKIA